jgi:hypothetical protein
MSAVLRRVLLLACIAAAFAVVAVSAFATRADTRWHIKTGPGNAFSGMYTNTTASVVNGVSIGTADAAKNPIATFTFMGQTCKLYAQAGSAFCYTGISVAPGKTVAFSGTTQMPVGSSGFQACDTADGGMDNTCLDVTVATAPTVDEKAVKSMKAEILFAIDTEERALRDLNSGKRAAASVALDPSVHPELANALKLGKRVNAPSASANVESALSDDEAAVKLLDGKATGSRIKKARALIQDALSDKKTALDILAKL